MITRRSRWAAAATGLVLLGSMAACDSDDTAAPSTTTAPPTTTTTTPPATTASATGSGKLPEKPCDLLRPEEIVAATGTTAKDAIELRGGCSWENNPDQVLDLEVEKPYGDAAHAFANEKTLYADQTAGSPGIGDDSFYEALDQGKVRWLQGGVRYDVWIHTTTHPATERQDALQLAKLVSGRL